MRISFICLFLLLPGIYIHAQQNDSAWIKKSLSDFGNVYIGISNEMGDFLEAESYFWGFDLGMYLYPFKKSMKNTGVKIGLGAAWLDNSISLEIPVSDRKLICPVNIKYGGIRTGMLFFTDALIIPSFDVLVASGDLRLQIPDSLYTHYKEQLDKQTVPVYIIMPKINLEIKITSSLKFGWGFSYRYVENINIPWINNTKTGNFGYHGTFTGVFGPKIKKKNNTKIK